MFTDTYQRPVVHAPSRVPTTPVLADLHLQPVQPLSQPELASMNHHTRYDLPRRTRASRPDPTPARVSGGIGVILLSLMALVLTGCGGGAGAADKEPDPPESATTVVAQESTAPEDEPESDDEDARDEGESDDDEDADLAADASEICEDDEFRIGERVAFDEAWKTNLEAASGPAQAWQPDAGFKQMSAMCWFGGELSWTIFHYSPEIDEWFAYPENEVHPPYSLEYSVIDLDAVSFADLRDWLHEAGYEDDDVLTMGVAVSPIASDLGDTDLAFAYEVIFGITEQTTVRVDGATGEVVGIDFMKGEVLSEE